MTKMATMSIYGKNPSNSSQEPVNRFQRNLTCIVDDLSTTYIMLPWSILQQGQHMRSMYSIVMGENG